MAGIYIHVPFCKKACHYCNFHFSVSLKNKNDFIAALLKEINLQQNYLQGQTITSVYLGGGTPSLLQEDDLCRIFAQLRAHFIIAEQAEITLEANPDDISAEKLRVWQRVGINRLSIGIQSFFEQDLQWMNRAHTAEQAKNCILLAQQEGFFNLSIDLIYGTPGLTDLQWQQNVFAAIALKIPHLSCYALTVEPGTRLQKLISLEKKEAVNSETQARQFLLLMDWLQGAGYEHYEISNFAQPGARSRHNSSYWASQKYLGLGPSAHSFDGTSRQWNIANNTLYSQSLEKDLVPFEKEILTHVQRLNEHIMISLRTDEGLNLSDTASRFGENTRSQLLTRSAKFILAGTLLLKEESLQLSRNGKLFADGIAADLFFTEKPAVVA